MFRRLLANVARRLHGKDDQIGYALVALVSEGHILLEDVPGVGKTSLARAIAESVSGTWNRVQFTPDLLPSDITGVSIFNQATREFEFRPGPIFANVVIGDEINRTSPKTQSALLEVMEERRVTVDGVAHLVPRPFVVVATQNPVDMDAGTYALPEAQLDRFLLKMSMGYPDAVAEAGIVLSRHGGAPGPLDPVLSLTDIERMVAIGVVRAHRPPGGAVHRVAGAGHPPDGGRAPRCQSARHDRAAARGPDDGRRGRPRLRDRRRRQAARRSVVLAHRLVVAPTAQLRGVTAERVIIDLLGRVAVPGGAVDSSGVTGAPDTTRVGRRGHRRGLCRPRDRARLAGGRGDRCVHVGADGELDAHRGGGTTGEAGAWRRGRRSSAVLRPRSACTSSRRRRSGRARSP